MAADELHNYVDEEDEEGSQAEDGDWGDWREDDDGAGGEVDGDLQSDLLCLFCDSRYASCDSLFEHCRLLHRFDFQGIRKELKLGFYSSFKLINYVRSQVAENKCWSCGLIWEPNQELQKHLHETVDLKDVRSLWDDDKYLKPFMQEDSLLYSFVDDEEDEEEPNAPLDREELMGDLQKFGSINVDDETIGESSMSSNDTCNGNRSKAVALLSNGNAGAESSVDNLIANGIDPKTDFVSHSNGTKHEFSGVCAGNLVARNIKKVNENYFGSYSSFGIHREMISDKVRTEAYRQAILENPSLLRGSVVMDVGCGTGILSLFAAQAGAARVVAVEASEKMAKVAAKIAKENGVCRSNTHEGVLEVAHCMVEDLDKTVQIQPYSVDVLVSEWMGYCLLYESMLSSVLYARDRWLKPGGAILPDTATMFVAGFGKGGTSLPFWENVYGFDMSCIGKELLEDAARIPIVDVIDDRDIVTRPALLQTFDLATMKPDEVDFTAIATLEPKEPESGTRQCYGVVLWFETGFTKRFCKENPTVLSTSPYTPKTHWAQTVLTFREPIAMAPATAAPGTDTTRAVGTDVCPASRIDLRVSIVRASEHRSVDISMETTGVASNGQKRGWPVQIFNIS